jgi:CRISPR/Cas system-associated exonuclease Cas4 (RecB family)
MPRKRNYENDYPSVTQVIDVMRKIGLEMWFKMNTPEFIKTESAKAKEIGTQLHEAIQSHIELNTLKVDTQYPAEITNALKSFMLFKKECPQIKLQKAEIKMTSEGLKVNGTLDCLGNDSEEVVLDWKSGNAKDDIKPPIYDEYLIQVAAYVYLYNETHKASIKKAYILALAKDKIAYNLEEINEEKLLIAWGIFTQCLGIYKDKKLLTILRKGE